MGAELDKFHDGFFAESLEALQVAENAALQLVPGAGDMEPVHTMFRVVHSIKGSAGMFGFNEVTSFTHALESLLQELRAGRAEATAAICDGLLQAVDRLREMLAARRHQQLPDLSQANALRLKFREWAAVSPSSPTLAVEIPVWRIRFQPLPELLRQGADPMRMFEELEALGKLVVQADCSHLPALPDVDPAHCHIRWDLALATIAPREAIEQVFEWACRNCELRIERLATQRHAIAMPADIDSIRVDIGKLDDILHRVEAIAAAQTMLEQLVAYAGDAGAGQMRAGLQQLGARIGDLRESVRQVRMLPAGTVFNRFPRLVRDLSAQLGKHIRLEISGERTELDRRILEKIGDPLVHLVRNSVDHGIESPEVRAARGKAAEGVVRLSAAQRGEQVQIVISDDGNGLDTGRLLQAARSKGLVEPGAELSDEEIHDLIFLPGFSTTLQANELSGRGVGMDVVRRNIRELGGSVELRSDPGRGTTTTITLSGPIYARNSA